MCEDQFYLFIHKDHQLRVLGVFFSCSSVEAFFDKYCHMPSQGKPQTFNVSLPATFELRLKQYVQEEILSGSTLRGEAVTSAPHFYAGGVCIRRGSVCSFMYSLDHIDVRNKSKAHKRIAFDLVISNPRISLSNTPSQSRLSRPVRATWQEVVPRLLHSRGCLHDHHRQPAHWMHVKPRAGMAPK